MIALNMYLDLKQILEQISLRSDDSRENIFWWYLIAVNSDSKLVLNQTDVSRMLIRPVIAEYVVAVT